MQHARRRVLASCQFGTASFFFSFFPSPPEEPGVPASVEILNSEMGRTKAATRLTPNQAAVLADLAEGLTVEEIATEWEVSQTVVYRNIEQARAKLGAKTIPHAVAIWMGMQLARSGGVNGHRTALAVNGTKPAGNV
jgi:DNA-binding NarL/FixJ family response regulator